MPRTTLDLDPLVVRELRRRGKRTGKSMGRVASELLVRALSESPPAEEAHARFVWTSRDLGKPRVDLEDPEAVRRVLDASS